ncbi:hypothetical protein EYC80_005820 [Monilinia laxa]|uniref:Ricin B lectin domain-containing protein n=1 Tax=Monilinia laxa TaxID=61186 RepID=A0A5N6KFF6_MONLA|nr:hypothetical protein EYC80_005820 [Monilinia laxa]
MAKQRISDNPPDRDISHNLLSHRSNILSGNKGDRTTPAAQSNSSKSANASSTTSVIEVDKIKNKVITFAIFIALLFIYILLKISFNQMECESVSDVDTSTVCGALTPPSTIVNDDNHKNNDKSSVPWPHSTFLIRSVSSGKLLTLQSGAVILAQPGDNRGSSIHWKCTEEKGWLHFQNAASGLYLGHAFHADLICNARRPDGWERFTARTRPEGGYHLLMTHWGNLWKVGINEGKLAKICAGEWGNLTNSEEGEGEGQKYVQQSNLEHRDGYEDLDRNEC